MSVYECGCAEKREMSLYAVFLLKQYERVLLFHISVGNVIVNHHYLCFVALRKVSISVRANFFVLAHP